MKKVTLYPIPKKVKIDSENCFNFNRNGYIAVCDREFAGTVITAKKNSVIKGNVAIGRRTSKADITVKRDPAIAEEGYRIEIGENGVIISASYEAGVFYAFKTLIQLVNQFGARLPYTEIEDKPYFKIRGYLFDISRDKIPTLDTLKEKVDMLADLKINHLELYIEGAPFSYNNYEDMWQGADPITGEDILELDRYCKERFIELVPTQNTFGHMGKWLFDGGYSNLAECPNGFINKDGGFVPWPMCLDPNDPEAFKLVTDTSDDLLNYFSSDKFNVCCDETLELGLGKSKAECAEKGIGRVYLDYLMKLYNYCKSKGKKMLFWADIINEYPELVAEFPKDVLVLNWGYYNDLPKESSCENFEKNGIPYCVCPGTAIWNTVTGNTVQAFDNIKTTVMKGVRHGAEGVINTEWGDCGHLQGNYSALPAAVYGAMMSWQPEINADADIADVINRMLGDRTEEIGSLLIDAGKYDALEKVHQENITFSFRLLRNNLTETDSVKECVHSDFDKVEKYIDTLLERAYGASDSFYDGQLIVSELITGLRAIKLAQEIGHFKIYLRDGNAAKVKEYGLKIRNGYNAVINGITDGWMKKNKVSNMHGALRPFVDNRNAAQQAFTPDNKKEDVIQY